jgi:hypothetical protein
MSGFRCQVSEGWRNPEFQTHLELARRLGFGESAQIDQAKTLSHEAGKMIYSILEEHSASIKLKNGLNPDT